MSSCWLCTCPLKACMCVYSLEIVCVCKFVSHYEICLCKFVSHCQVCVCKFLNNCQVCIYVRVLACLLIHCMNSFEFDMSIILFVEVCRLPYAYRSNSHSSSRSWSRSRSRYSHSSSRSRSRSRSNSRSRGRR